ncbi:MAG TPA: hypothetical protein VIL84_10415 [Devosiaceae bacterium]
MKLLIATVAAAAIGMAGFAMVAEAAQPSPEQCSNELFAANHKAYCANVKTPMLPNQYAGATSGPGNSYGPGPGNGQYD